MAISRSAPTAAQMRVMRADAARVRAQHDTEPYDVDQVDVAVGEVHGADCRQCTVAVAS